MSEYTLDFLVADYSQIPCGSSHILDLHPFSLLHCSHHLKRGFLKFFSRHIMVDDFDGNPS